MTRDNKPETLEELKECLENPWWIMTNLMAIKDKGQEGKVVKFRPNAVQKKLYKSYWWNNFILKSRQHGVSTFSVIMFLCRLLIERSKIAGVIDIKEDAAKKKLAMAKLSYENMDNPAIHDEQWEMIGEEGKRAMVSMWEIGAKLKAAVRMTKGGDAPFPQEIVFSNGSLFYAGVSFRGDTLQYGLFTEFGPIALKFPDKAAEIVEGAENAMHEGSIAIYETTMEGGQSTLAFERCELAMKNSRDREELTRLDPLFLFYAWFEDPVNRLNEKQTDMAMLRYNANDIVDTRHGEFNWRLYFLGGIDENGNEIEGVVDRVNRESRVDLDWSQIAWYIKKRTTQGWAMLKEHPTFPEEAFQAPIMGAIYAEGILRAEADGRVSDFSPIKGRLVHTTWDIGSSHNTVVWFWQRVGPEWRCLRCESGMNGKTIGEFVGDMLKMGYTFGIHALPHDGAHAKIGEITYKKVLEEAGLSNVKIIPVTADFTLRIDGMWSLLPNIRFNKSLTEAGLKKLKGYRYKQDPKTENVTGVIVKDGCDHYADAWGYLWEAEEASLLPDFIVSPNRGDSVQKRKVTVGGL